jgi:phosphatidate cytidylyltransferase
VNTRLDIPFGRNNLLLGRRLFSAAILIGSVLVAIGMDARQPLLESPGLWLVPVMAFFVGGTAWEFGQLASRQVPIKPVVPMLLSLLLIVIASVPIFYRAVFAKAYPVDCPIGILGWIGVGSACVCGLAGIAMLRSFATGDTQAVERWALLTLIPTYAGGLGAFWVAIRLSAAPLHALMILVGIIAVTKITDASAYFAGKSLGRTKLCPNISPGKTVEGAIAGLLAGMVVAWLYFGCLVPWMQLGDSPKIPWWGPVLVGGLLGLVGLIGDLIESVVKRSVGAKDSGNLLPGLGGIWDVTDSLLPTAVVGYLGIVAHWI